MPKTQYTSEQVIAMIEKGESLAHANLSGIFLLGADFRSKEDGGPCDKVADFSNANLTNSALIAVNFQKACLTKTNFYGAMMDDADLSNAILRKAILRNAELNNAKLNGAFLYEADLSYAFLDYADIREAKLASAVIQRGHFVEADLRKADFHDAILRNSIFDKAILTEADLSSADLREASMREVVLVNATLVNTVLNHVDLTNADISGALLVDISCLKWKIEGIKCTHIYQCPDWRLWEDKEDREKYRRNFEPGEFERRYKDSGFLNDSENIITEIRSTKDDIIEITSYLQSEGFQDDNHMKNVYLPESETNKADDIHAEQGDDEISYLFRKDGKTWTLCFNGKTITIIHLVGMNYKYPFNSFLT